jgi:hypothetical protein
MDSAEKLSDGVKKTLDNQYLFWSLMLFAIVFGWLARPPLPNWLLAWFDNPIFQYLVLFALVYTGSKDLKAAFWSPLIFMAIMYLLSFTENKDRNKKPEGFEDGEDMLDNEQPNDVEDTDGEEGDDVELETDLVEGDIEEEEADNNEEAEEDEVIENEEFEDNPIISSNTMNKMNKAKKQLENAIKKVNLKSKNVKKSKKSLNEGFSDAYNFSNCGCGF